MRKYEKHTRTVDETVLTETACDLCGKIAKKGNWESSSYEVNEVDVEVIVRQKNGKSYPEGGWGTALQVDICPDCFINILVPFLRSKGAQIEEREWDF
jgi:hypothetical protein